MSHRKKHIVVLDPTAFSGGSKVATAAALSLLDREKFTITVFTADKNSWQSDDLQVAHLIELPLLEKVESGIGYFIRHGFIASQLFLLTAKYGRIDLCIGASGPGVDLSLYLFKALTAVKVIQLIHGPVAFSRSIGKCLLAADEVHYLASTENTIYAALHKVTQDIPTALPSNFYLMSNGLRDDRWPTPCQQEKPVVFWAASLLKWKGLDILLSALTLIPADDRLSANICYIKPKDTLLEAVAAPVEMSSVNWFEQPNNLDEIRANSNIFVSTSSNEPFGLSILEAMAAGHCVFIPRDGAYWDKKLNDNEHCIKYSLDHPSELAMQLLLLSHDMNKVKRLGKSAAELAKSYRASRQYALLKNHIEQQCNTSCNNHSYEESVHENNK